MAYSGWISSQYLKLMKCPISLRVPLCVSRRKFKVLQLPFNKFMNLLLYFVNPLPAEKLSSSARGKIDLHRAGGAGLAIINNKCDHPGPLAVSRVRERFRGFFEIPYISHVIKCKRCG